MIGIFSRCLLGSRESGMEEQCKTPIANRLHYSDTIDNN